MKITKIIKDDVTTYFYNGVKKYTHYKGSNGYERWREYDGRRNEIHCKDNDGYEWWSDDNPDNPENKLEEVKEEDVKAFQFN